MRIIFLSYHYSPGFHSPQEWIDRIAFYNGLPECLAREHKVIRIDQVDFTGIHTHNGVTYHFVDDGKRKKLFPLKLNRLVKKLGPDAVVAGGLLYPLQVIQLRALTGKNVKILLQHHAEQPFTGLKKFIQRWASRKVDAILFTALQTGLDWIKQGNLHAQAKIKELMEVSSVFKKTDRSTARKVTGASGSPVFLWVGRLNENKDPLLVVDAFLQFAGLHPEARLFMLYHTDELLPEIIKMLERSPGKNQVILKGKLEHAALSNWYNSADYFLAASHYEGSGTALCEAMSCGCIPIVSDIPTFRMITNGCGLLFEPGNPDQLIHALKQTVEFDLLPESEKCLEAFNKNLSFEAIAKKMNEILNATDQDE